MLQRNLAKGIKIFLKKKTKTFLKMKKPRLVEYRKNYCKMRKIKTDCCSWRQ